MAHEKRRRIISVPHGEVIQNGHQISFDLAFEDKSIEYFILDMEALPQFLSFWTALYRRAESTAKKPSDDTKGMINPYQPKGLRVGLTGNDCVGIRFLTREGYPIDIELARTTTQQLIQLLSAELTKKSPPKVSH